jgi:carboxypeptidase family protein
MKRSGIVTLLLLVIFLSALPLSYAKDKNEGSGRLLTGRVTDQRDQPLAGSVVFVSNTVTRATKSYIVGPDGVYRFPALLPYIEYEVYARYNGRESDAKTLGQFDTRPTVNINLKINTRQTSVK